MTVTITITDPTATEATALRAYLTALHGGTADGPRLTGSGELFIGGDKISDVQTVTITPIDPADLDGPTPQEVSDYISENADRIVTAEDAGAPDFDSAGYPWDERIHAGSRATVADGTWRKKRGVSPEEVERVEAELKRLCLDEGCDHHGTPHECVAPTADTVQEQSAPEVPDAPEQEQHIQTSPIPEVAEASVDAPPPPPAATPNPFLAVMSRIGKSKLDKAKKDELLTAAGALDDKGNPSILVLNKRPELIDGFVALLDSEGV